jgi:myosin heavy subunit
LPTLDEVQLFPKSSDELFASRLIEIHEKNPFFARNVKDPKNFKIKHYAGEVR